MRQVLMAVLVFTSMTTHAWAQAESPEHVPSPDDISRIDACVTASASPRKARGECVGPVARDCMEQTRMTTADMANCTLRERNAWRALLERDAARRRAQQSEWQNTTLDEFLRVGEEWDSARCAYEASADEGGTMSQLTGSACVRDSTAERAIMLLFR